MHNPRTMETDARKPELKWGPRRSRNMVMSGILVVAMTLLHLQSTLILPVEGFGTTSGLQRTTSQRRQYILFSNSIGDSSEERRPPRISSIAPIEMGSFESEAFPRRPYAPPRKTASADRFRQPYNPKTDNQEEDWGISKLPEGRVFPCTAEQVVEEAFSAIAGTIHNKQTMNPHIVSNARSISPLDYRPVRKNSDSGRIGIELAGTRLLFSDRRRHQPRVQHQHEAIFSEQEATRRLSLMLAAKLSTGSAWTDYESDETQSNEDVIKREPMDRPVAVYFNTVKQALMASSELRQLIQEELATRGKDDRTSDSTSYDMVSIQCLGDEIPAALRGATGAKRRRYRGLTEGKVNCDYGLILVVQPTDFNNEYRPPGPALGAVTDFQKLAAQASILELPTVAISPRFLSDENYLRGFDQSGYQRAGVYGGAEPPKGPTPWIMRDFTPPSFCWIGNALHLGTPRRSEFEGPGCFLSRMSIMQSVMDEQHAWHMFAAKECSDGTKALPTSYQYLASTRSAHGRPTKNLLRKIIQDL